VIAILATIVVLFIVFPKLFGFKDPVPEVAPNKVPLPWWFYAGTLVTLVCWWLMWARPVMLTPLIYYTFTPLWWGFITALDGFVYSRNNGRSLMASKSAMFWFSAVFSVVGWFYFEIYDYFNLSNWYYPNSVMPELSHRTIVILYLVAYSTVTPAVLQWYTLLQTFPNFVARYKQGMKIPSSGNVILTIGVLLIAAATWFPFLLFFGVWLGPLLIVGGALMRIGIWSPLEDLKQGDWRAVVSISLACIFNGFIWELWNHGSEYPSIGYPTNPNFWVYDVPYVNVIHIFSEMPLLGYFGYMPFGIFVWVFFIWAAKLLNKPSDLNFK
jgi:hypothetical protein